MLDQFIAHGYYQVGDQTYFNKLEALYEATATKQPVSWIFHDNVYDKFNWTQRPPGTLRELYKQRAQQIRDEYDYVIVHFGGGMDSWTVLDSFLSNGIHVDEVYTRWPRAERKYMSADSTNFNEVNLGSEFEYATLPVLEHLRKHHPKTYIYIDDISECFHGDFKEQTLIESNNFQSMGTYYRYGRKSDVEEALSKKDKKIAVVLGHDKTCVSYHDNHWYAYFVDVGMGTDNDKSRVNEWFYWTPKFPTIPILQAHCLIDKLEQTNRYVDKGPIGARDWGLGSDSMRITYARACYPDYNINTFQTGKPLGTLIRHSEAWVSQYNPRYFQSWKWNVWQLLNGISADHLKTGRKHDLVLGTKNSNSRKYLVR
jgi:hypothetical protein